MLHLRRSEDMNANFSFSIVDAEREVSSTSTYVSDSSEKED
jgi:hypothetical protein